MLVSVAELRQKLNGVRFNDGQVSEATILLSGLQEEIETFLNRPVEPTLVRELASADANGIARLAVTPVISVFEVSRFGTTNNTVTSSWTSIAPKDRDGYPEGRKMAFMGNGYIVPGGVRVGVPGVSYFVEYVGGLTGTPVAGIKRAILQIAARTWTAERGDAVALQDGNPSDTDNLVGPSGWTYEELGRFARYQRRVVR